MKSTLKLLASLMLVLGLSACQPKLSSENLAKVTNGMNIQEVEKILGEPTSVETQEIPLLSRTIYTYESGDDFIKLVFVNNNLISKEGSVGNNQK